MLKKFVLLVIVALSSGLAVAEKPSMDGQYDYRFPSDRATPFDAWNTKGAIMKPEDKDAAEFAGMFAGKMMTIVSRVEDTKTGKRAYVVVANQRCLIDMVRHEGEYRASATKCSTKPFGKF